MGPHPDVSRPNEARAARGLGPHAWDDIIDCLGPRREPTGRRPEALRSDSSSRSIAIRRVLLEPLGPILLCASPPLQLLSPGKLHLPAVVCPNQHEGPIGACVFLAAMSQGTSNPICPDQRPSEHLSCGFPGSKVPPCSRVPCSLLTCMYRVKERGVCVCSYPHGPELHRLDLPKLPVPANVLQVIILRDPVTPLVSPPQLLSSLPLLSPTPSFHLPHATDRLPYSRPG